MTSEKEKRITATHERPSRLTIHQVAHEVNWVEDSNGRNIGSSRNMEGAEAIVQHYIRNNGK
jgi:hypothetical protein